MTFTQRGAKDLMAAVDALAGSAEKVAFVDRVAGANALSLLAVGDRIRVQVLWPGDEPLDLPGFDVDHDERLTQRDVERDEAVAATEVALRALGIGPDDPLFIHLGT